MQQMLLMMFGSVATAASNNNRYLFSNRECSMSLSPPLASAVLPQQALKRSNSATSVPVDYPQTVEWLNSLQESPTRNKYKEKFAEYATVLVETHQLFTIQDLASFSSSELAAVGGMGVGTASRILRYIKEDIATLDRGSRKKMRY